MLWACQAVDVAYVNDMRNFLGLGNVPDLSSIDVFRGRDCGVASYADARQHYGLRRPTVMSDLTNVPKLLVRGDRVCVLHWPLSQLLATCCRAR